MKNILHITIIFICITSCTSQQQKNETTFEKLLQHTEGEPVVPRTANKIYIQLIRNPVINHNLHEIMMLKIQQSITEDRRLAVVNNKKQADLLLLVKMGKLEIQPVSFDDLGRVTQKRIRITAILNLININNKSVILYEPEMQAFLTFSDRVPPIINELNAREQCMIILAQRVAEKSITGWYTRLMTKFERGKK